MLNVIILFFQFFNALGWWWWSRWKDERYFYKKLSYTPSY